MTAGLRHGLAQDRGHRPLAPRPPVRRAGHRLQQAVLLHRPAAARPGRAAARPRLPGRRGAEGRRGRRRRGGRGRDPGRPARGRAAGRRDLARDLSGGQRRAAAVELCPRRLRAARPRRHRGRPAAPARPRPARGRPRPSARCCTRCRSRSRSTAAGRSGRLRPVRAAAGDRGASGHRVAAPALRNLLACLERCHIEVKGVVSASYAAAVACLAEDELERGCLVLDFGGGTTGLAHFAGGRLTLVDQVPYGGDHVTGDLAYGLSTSRQHAERIKNLFGGTQFRSCDEGTRIELRGSATMPSCRPARCRAPGSPRSCAPGSRRSWRWPGAAWTSIASCWRPGRRARSCSPAAAASSRGSRSWSRRCSACRPAAPGPVALVGQPPGRALLRHGRRGGGAGARRRWRPGLARSDRGLGALAPSCETWPMV